MLQLLGQYSHCNVWGAECLTRRGVEPHGNVRSKERHGARSQMQRAFPETGYGFLSTR